MISSLLFSKMMLITLLLLFLAIIGFVYQHEKRKYRQESLHQRQKLIMPVLSSWAKILGIIYAVYVILFLFLR